jgi:polysaccharide pyruvyl transferase WcaK-like protein
MFGDGNLGDEAMLVAGKDNIPNNRAIGTKRNSSYPFIQKALNDKCRKDLLVAGGTLIHGGNRGWLEYVQMRMKQGARVSVFGAGISFLEDEIKNRVPTYTDWTQVLQKSSSVQLRGPLSTKVANEMGVEAKVFGDFAFLLYDQNLCSIKQSTKPTIGINIGECLGDQFLFETKMVNIINNFKGEFFIEFFIVIENDKYSTDRVIKAALLTKDQYRVRSYYFNPVQFMFAVKKCKMFIGVKLHASGLAMVCGTPALLFSYKPKCKDFTLPIELEHALISMNTSEHLIEKKIQDVLQKPNDFINTKLISEFCSLQKKTLSEHFST